MREREKLVRVYVFARQRRERRWGWWREGRVRRREIGQRERRERRCLEFSTKPTSLPTRRVFVVLDGRLRTRIASNASRFEIERERERGGRMTGEKRRREGKKEKKGRRRGRSTLEALRALLCPRGRVCGSEISRGPSFTSSPLPSSSTLRPVFRAFANLHLPSGYTSLPSGRPSQLHGSPSFPREPRVHEMQPIFPSALA